jgi:RimJ/RimL family protein N-acetyltransferase
MSANLAAIATRLHAADRDIVQRHFLQLSADDRRLRFGATLSDDAVIHYVQRIDFVDDGIYAVSDDDLRLIGVVHIAFGAQSGQAAELGLSVLEGVRGLGIGNALFARATMHLRNRAVGEVIIHCLSENAAMMHLARKHGMQLLRDGADSEARLALPVATGETIMLEWLQDQQARYVGTVRENSKLARAMFTIFQAKAKPVEA